MVQADQSRGAAAMKDRSPMVTFVEHFGGSEEFPCYFVVTTITTTIITIKKKKKKGSVNEARKMAVTPKMCS